MNTKTEAYSNSLQIIIEELERDENHNENA